jgi:hypothetical protein
LYGEEHQVYTIDITYPVDESINNSCGGYFTILTNALWHQQSYVIVEFYDGETIGSSDFYSIARYTGGILQGESEIDIPIFFNAPSNTELNARARWYQGYDTSGTLIATSPVISYTTGNCTSDGDWAYDPATPTGTPSSLGDYFTGVDVWHCPISLSVISDDWALDPCAMAHYMIVPTGEYDGFIEAKDELKLSFPFTFIFDITDSMKAGIASASTAALSAYNVVFSCLGEECLEYELLSEDTITAIADEDILTDFRDMIEMILWLSFGLHILAIAYNFLAPSDVNDGLLKPNQKGRMWEDNQV